MGVGCFRVEGLGGGGAGTWVGQRVAMSTLIPVDAEILFQTETQITPSVSSR